jgi:tetratricopeptide (TPR) repeat protein
MAVNLLNSPIGPSLKKYLLEKTSGIPFLVEQFLLDLNERGALRQQNKIIEIEPNAIADIPTNIHAILVSRLDRLSSQVKNIVQTAAILGREFEIAILSRMVNDDPFLPVYIAEAEKQSIWNVLQQIRCLFKHALLCDAAYQMQFHKRLRQLHILALNAIESLYPHQLDAHYEELAYHARQGQQADQQRKYEVLAGAAAQAAYQNNAALDHYRALLPLLPPQETIHYQLQIAEIEEHIGNSHIAAKTYHQAIRLARQFNDMHQLVQAQMMLGHFHHQRGQFALARRWLKCARINWETLKNPAGICQTLLYISSTYIRQSRYPLAEKIAKQALNLAQQTQNLSSIALALKNLGIIAFYQTQYESAKQYYQQSLSFYREVDDKPGISAILNNLGIILNEQGCIAESRALCTESLTIDRQIGDKWGIGIALNNLGQSAEQMGDIEAARLCYEESATVCQEIGDQIGAAYANSNLAGIAMLNNNLPLAHTLYSTSSRIFRRSDDLRSTSIVLRNLAEIDLQLGNYSAARQQMLESLAITQQIEDLRGIAYCIIGLVRILHEHSSTAASPQTTWHTLVRWIATAQTIQAQNGFIFEGQIAQKITEILQIAQNQLTQADFQSANAAGSQLTIEQIIAEVNTSPET